MIFIASTLISERLSWPLAPRWLSIFSSTNTQERSGNPVVFVVSGRNLNRSRSAWRSWTRFAIRKDFCLPHRPQIWREIDTQNRLTRLLALLEGCIAFIVASGATQLADGEVLLEEYILGTLLMDPKKWEEVSFACPPCHSRRADPMSHTGPAGAPPPPAVPVPRSGTTKWTRPSRPSCVGVSGCDL